MTSRTVALIGGGTAGPLLQRDHVGVDVHCAGAETIVEKARYQRALIASLAILANDEASA